MSELIGQTGRSLQDSLKAKELADGLAHEMTHEECAFFLQRVKQCKKCFGRGYSEFTTETDPLTKEERRENIPCGCVRNAMLRIVVRRRQADGLVMGETYSIGEYVGCVGQYHLFETSQVDAAGKKLCNTIHVGDHDGARKVAAEKETVGGSEARVGPAPVFGGKS